MASAVATPLERQFGRIAAVNQMTSSSQLGTTSIALQFDLNRNIDAAARDVQASINAARSQLPANLPSNPSYRKVNPSDSPILLLGLTSDTQTVPQMYDAADSILAQKLSQVNGVGQVFVWGSAQPAVRAEVNPTLLNKLGVGLTRFATLSTRPMRTGPRARFPTPRGPLLYRHRSTVYGGPVSAADRGLQQRRAGATWRCGRGRGFAGGRA